MQNTVDFGFDDLGPGWELRDKQGSEREGYQEIIRQYRKDGEWIAAVLATRALRPEAGQVVDQEARALTLKYASPASLLPVDETPSVTFGTATRWYREPGLGAPNGCTVVFRFQERAVGAVTLLPVRKATTLAEVLAELARIAGLFVGALERSIA